MTFVRLHMDLEELKDLVDFIERATKNFNENPTHHTYGDIEPNSWFAVRWGLSDRAILVLKLHDEYTPFVVGDQLESRR
jgi:hypothetical protein